jgi:hypothetical protein
VCPAQEWERHLLGHHGGRRRLSGRVRGPIPVGGRRVVTRTVPYGSRLMSSWASSWMMAVASRPAVSDPSSSRQRALPTSTTFCPVDLSRRGVGAGENLPTGLALVTDPVSGDFAENEFRLSGVPRTRGTYRFTVVATNLFGQIDHEGHTSGPASSRFRRQRRRISGSAGRGVRRGQRQDSRY